MMWLRRLLRIPVPGRSQAPPAPAAEPTRAIPVHAVGEAVAPPLSAEDRDTLIRTLYGEARGESEAGQVAVVHVIRNRVLARNTSAHVECRRPWQFSCWNVGDPNLARLIEMPTSSLAYVRLGAVVDRAWLAPDTVRGARHYYAPKGMADGKPPRWALHPQARQVARIGGHIFFADVP
jgi:N-acetylmuramoyl-L-alanine amidase